MRRPSSLDRWVENFQHNWETNPQFRAMWSGGLGLAIVVILCASLGFAFTFASYAAAAFNPSTTTGQSLVTVNGTPRPGSADSTLTFPTQTVPPWAAPQIPAGVPIPPSTTPQPTATAAPTATPVPFNPGGGGGGGGGGCGGCSMSITGSSPSPMKAGTTAQILITTSNPNAQILVNINWPQGGHDFPAGSGTTNAQGQGSITVTVPGGCNGAVQVLGYSNNSGDGNATLQCAP